MEKRGKKRTGDKKKRGRKIDLYYLRICPQCESRGLKGGCPGCGRHWRCPGRRWRQA